MLLVAALALPDGARRHPGTAVAAAFLRALHGCTVLPLPLLQAAAQRLLAAAAAAALPPVLLPLAARLAARLRGSKLADSADGGGGSSYTALGARLATAVQAQALSCR